MQNLQQTILLQDGRTPEGKLMFFDHAKKALESREMYEDFLKTLTLFSKDIFGVKDLIDRAKVFLGDGDLLAEFKELLGYDERRESIEYGPPGSLRMGPPEALLAQPTDDGQGPSYRRLPDSVCHGHSCFIAHVLITALGNIPCMFGTRRTLSIPAER